MLADNAAAALEQAEADNAGLLLSVSSHDDVEILALQAAQGFDVELETLLILVVRRILKTDGTKKLKKWQTP